MQKRIQGKERTAGNREREGVHEKGMGTIKRRGTRKWKGTGEIEIEKVHDMLWEGNGYSGRKRYRGRVVQRNGRCIGLTSHISRHTPRHKPALKICGSRITWSRPSSLKLR